MAADRSGGQHGAAAPQVLAFFELAPFFGKPFGILSAFVEHGACVVIAVRTALGLTLGQAVLAASLGWLLLPDRAARNGHADLRRRGGGCAGRLSARRCNARRRICRNCGGVGQAAQGLRRREAW